MAKHNRQRRNNIGAAPARQVDEADPIWNEAPQMVLDDEEEVHDLGFIVDDHDDRRIDLLEPWQRLQSLDTDEPLEEDPDGPLPAEATEMRRRAVPPDWYPVDFHTQNKEAEADEEEFAEDNRLVPDPEEEELTTVYDDQDDVSADLDRDEEADTVSILGRAPGIATGFGTTLAQDIGPDGFAIRDNPLVVPAEGLKYPISTDALSDEARGLRDVDEMGSEEELDALADQGSRLEEPASRRPRRRATRR